MIFSSKHYTEVQPPIKCGEKWLFKLDIFVLSGIKEWNAPLGTYKYYAHFIQTNIVNIALIQSARDIAFDKLNLPLYQQIYCTWIYQYQNYAPWYNGAN